MGCSASKLEDEEAVRLCKDRRNFIKQAVEQRTRFASGHIAYIQSLRQISLALHNFVDGEEHHHDFLLDSYTTPPFTPVKRLSPEIIGIPMKSFTPTPNQSEKSTIHVMKYLRSGGNPSVSVEEWPQSPETARIDSYYPPNYYGIDGFFAMEASPMNPSFFPSPYNRPNYPPPSPQNSQWDFFWNPFSSLDTYGYPSQMTSDDEMARLRQVREEEGIPELEEVEEDGNREAAAEKEEEEEEFIEVEVQDERSKTDSNPSKVTVSNGHVPQANIKTDTLHEVKGLQSQGMGSVEVAKEHNAVEHEVTKNEEVVRSREAAEETPGFTVYVNRRPTSMGEVMKEIENQFMRICECAHEVSLMLEASTAQYSSSSRELAAIRMLNPVALFHSASSRSSSSRFFHASSSSRDDAYDSGSDYSEESCMISGSHQSTLDRLYAWEKKLYEEVKSGERIRVAYEKKCLQLRNQDVNGDEPSAVHKTRAALRDLQTRLKVSIHSVESISKRIETLRDEELHPQLMELIQGLARMWRTMADCHRIQKRTIDEAKLLLISSSFPTVFSTSASKPYETSPTKPPRSATNLESELRNWRSCLSTWIEAQRSYARALAGWAHRCADPDVGGTPPPVFGVCVQWFQLMDSVSEAQVIDGLDFFAAGIGSVCAGAEKRGEEIEGMMTAEKTAEIAGRVLCAGMSVAVGSLAEFAVTSAEGYDELGKRWKEGGRERVAET